ncbi:hypothetical protein D1872_318310 [compost metagenome]
MYSAAGVMLPSALFVPPMMYRWAISGTMVGSFWIAIAMFVSGAMASSEISPGFACTFSMMKSTAWPVSGRCTAFGK